MPGYQQIMRAVSNKVNKQLGELLSVEQTLEDTSLQQYIRQSNKYKDYPIYFNNIPRTMEFIKQTNEEVFKVRILLKLMLS